jgi:hypothetical protein
LRVNAHFNFDTESNHVRGFETAAVYTAFNTTVAQLTANNNLSLYNVPATCFGLYMTTIMAVSDEIQ